MMEHAKKMILVEPRVLENMTRNQPIEDATNRDLKETSQSMKDILESDDAAYDKANAYQQALWGFLKRFEQYKDRPLGKVQLTSDSKPISSTSKSGDESTSLEDESGVVRDVIASVPISLRNKAGRLLKRLKSNPQVKWNELGELEYDGRVIKQSNLTDLVNDVLRKRRRTPDPLGWDVFADALRQVNVAQDLIGNPKRWDYIRKIPAAESITEEKTPVTGKSKIPVTVKRKASRKSRYQTFYSGDDDDDEKEEEGDDWATPHQTPRKRDKNPSKKKLTWTAFKK